MGSDMTGSPPGNMRVFDQPEFQEKHPHLTRMRGAIAHGRNFPLAPFFGKIWYEIFVNKVLDVVMEDPNADIARAMHAVTKDAQKIADDYWKIHPQSIKGMSRKRTEESERADMIN